MSKYLTRQPLSLLAISKPCLQKTLQPEQKDVPRTTEYLPICKRFCYTGAKQVLRSQNIPLTMNLGPQILDWSSRCKLGS